MPLADYHEQFASVYDAFYQDRDVTADVRYAADLLMLDPRRSGVRVLDFGCGTGSHVLAFAAHGIEAVGFDASLAMISRAREKAAPAGAAAHRFEGGTFRDFCTRMNGTRFDGAVSIFQVLNCITSPELMLEHLRLIRNVLVPQGRFLVDVWNGAAVFEDDPRPEVRHVRPGADPMREIVRITVPEVNRLQQTCTLNYRVLILNGGSGESGTHSRVGGKDAAVGDPSHDRTVDRGVEVRQGRGVTEFESTHRILFLTPTHYRQLFQMAELHVLDEFPKHKPGMSIRTTDWYISYLLERR